MIAHVVALSRIDLPSLNDDQGRASPRFTRIIMTDSAACGIFEGMKGHQKAAWIPHGSVGRFTEKSLHGMQKDNEREARIGSFADIKRDMRVRLQDERPGASSAEIEAIIERRCNHGKKPYQHPVNLT